MRFKQKRGSKTLLHPIQFQVKIEKTKIEKNKKSKTLVLLKVKITHHLNILMKKIIKQQIPLQDWTYITNIHI